MCKDIRSSRPREGAADRWGSKEGGNQGRGRGRGEEPAAPSGTARPKRRPLPITLARMSMVVQVSISCMDTGVCPSAFASRISTSCSAFSLNVSIKLTKELGKQHPHQRPPGPVQGGGCPTPLSPEGAQSAEWQWWSLPADWGCSNQTEPWVCPTPLCSGWPLSLCPVLMVPRVFHLPLGPSTLTSRGCGSIESPQDNGKGGKQGLWRLPESVNSPPPWWHSPPPHPPCPGLPSAHFIPCL